MKNIDLSQIIYYIKAEEYFQNNLGESLDNFIGERIERKLIFEKDGYFKIDMFLYSDLLSQNIYVNEYGELLNLFGYIVSYVGPIIEINLKGSKFKVQEIELNTNYYNIIFYITEDLQLLIKLSDNVFLDTTLLDNVLNNDINYSNFESKFPSKSNLIKSISKTKFNIKNLEGTFRKIKTIKNKDYTQYILNEETGKVYKDLGFSIEDYINIGYINNNITNNINKDLGYSYYSIYDKSIDRGNNKAIYNHETQELLTDFIYSSIGYIEDENSKIIVGQEKKDWLFRDTIFYGIYDLNERKLITKIRYSYSEIQNYLKELPYTKVFSAIEYNLDPELKESLNLSNKYENYKKVLKQKEKEFLELQKSIEEKKRQVKEEELATLKQMEEEYIKIQNKKQELEREKLRIQNQYGLDIVSALQEVAKNRI